MAVLIYSNGILEDYNPQHHVFSEEEILTLFSEFPDIRTVRIPTVLNTWCVYGYRINSDDPNDYNRIAAEILEEDVYSHALFIHDSEINPDWNASDRIIYKSYNEFLETLKKIVDNVANNIVKEYIADEDYEEKLNNLPLLETLGTTPDKRIMFSYNPDKQINTFVENDEFDKFSQKAYEYISKNPQLSDPFTFYADKRAVLVVDKNKVESFLASILENFKKREEYEICTHLTKIIDEWTVINKDNSNNKNNSATY